MTNVTELQDRVRHAVSTSEALCIQGGDSKRKLGREPAGSPIDVSTLSGVVEYQPTELMITVLAGTRITALKEVLAEENQMLACEPPEFGGAATIGGTLACNQSGPSRPWLGSIRDHVLGIRLINGKAEHLRFGGQVMKNVAGYDVSRLQAGAMGAFGILTEVSLKVLPKPEASITVRREVDAHESVRLMNEISTTPIPLTGACWHDGEMSLRLSGTRSVIETTASKLPGKLNGDSDLYWHGLHEQTLPFFDTAKNLWRLSLRPNSPHFKEQRDWLIDWGGAQRWLAGQDDLEELQTIAAGYGGEVSLIRGGDRGGDVLPPPDKAKRDLLVRLKQAFDPAGVFNPGRLYSWL